MPIQLRHRALYAAFDRYPSQKGAAVHISKMARTLFEVMGGGLLYVLGGEDLPLYQREGTIEILRFSQPIPNVLERAIACGRRLSALLNLQSETLELCHFRDPWSGVPILSQPNRRYAAVYEINGLPSIELPYAYPHAAPRTLAKIRAAEEFCWSEADLLLAPSEAMRDNLVALGAPASKIVVVPNGADLQAPVPPPPDAPSRYVLYFGALQPWQGVDVLLRAFALLADMDDLFLVVCASIQQRQAKVYQRLAERLGIAGRMRWHFQLTEQELAPWRANALLSIAPLTECSRNVEQGCCPLKILESMASGVPVVASDLRSVRELIDDGIDGRLVRPGRPAELARTIRVLLEYPDQRRAMAARARAKIESRFTWDRTTAHLADLYRSLCPAIAGNQPVQ